MNKKVIIIGASGHAKVIADIVIKNEDILLGFLDDNLTGEVIGYSILGKTLDLDKFKNNEIQFIIGIGNNITRKEISTKYNLNYYTAIHPSAVISNNVEIQEGTAIMANAVINISSKIGKHCIINTGSIIEHDNILKDYVHISPNATLSGTVTIGECTHIGTSASIKNNINICDNVVVGVGGVVVKDINESGVYIGMPTSQVKK
ncbi:MAG: acetyltransferase [Clostridia bacterium]|nr:acetyltransferase [Clostridia bacterium]MDD4386503.1 acetyltransferase [Clostridia bacterium]